jgi:hypothetical protein
MTVLRLRKFAPEPPIIYPALASQIGALTDEEAQAVINFYIALGAWRREVESVADEFQEHRQRLVDPERLSLLARRLRRTLAPGKRAIATLAKYVPAAEEVERNAMSDGDLLFPRAHPNAGKTVRERIDLILAATHE